MRPESDDLKNKVALVTGAARGIGFAISTRLASAGAHVGLVDIDGDGVRSAAKHVNGVAFALDITDPDAVSESVDRFVRDAGALHILVNNAGIAGRSAPTWELSVAEWEQVIKINLSGIFYMCRATLPHMRRQKYGRIVNIASIAGKEGNPNAVPYSASKAGVIGLTKAIAKEVVMDGILVNCITPAVIETQMLDQVGEQHKQYMLSRIPMGRAGRPEEVAEMVAWLASDRCTFSTGAVFDASGGRATY